MSSIIVAGDTSGTVTLAAPAVSGTTTLTLPATSGTLLQSGTAVTAAQGGTGLTAVGTSGNLLTSNGTAWVSSAPAAAGPVIKYVTDATDITLVNVASSYVTVGSTFSVSIPTTGFINLRSFAGRITYSSGAAETALVFGIRISSTNYWLGTSRTFAGATGYGMISTDSNSAGYEEFYGSPKTFNRTYLASLSSMVSDITVASIPTGTQTVQLIAAAYTAYAPGLGILKGTTTTTRVALEFVSAS